MDSDGMEKKIKNISVPAGAAIVKGWTYSENGRFSAGPCWDKDRPSYRHSCYKWEGRAMYTSSDH